MVFFQQIDGVAPNLWFDDLIQILKELCQDRTVQFRIVHDQQLFLGLPFHSILSPSAHADSAFHLLLLDGVDRLQHFFVLYRDRGKIRLERLILSGARVHHHICTGIAQPLKTQIGRRPF